MDGGVDKEAYIHQPSALLSSDPFSARFGRFVDLISTGRLLRKKCFGQSVTKGFIDTLPEAFSRRSTVHRAQIDIIEHLGVVYCVDHLDFDVSGQERSSEGLNGVRKN